MGMNLMFSVTMLLLALFATLSLVTTAPTYPSNITPDLDLSTAYLQFFRVKQLIDQINIKRFEEFYGGASIKFAHLIKT